MASQEPSKPVEAGATGGDIDEATAAAIAAAAGEGTGEDDDLPAEILELTTEQLRQRVRMMEVRAHVSFSAGSMPLRDAALQGNIRIMKQEKHRLVADMKKQDAIIKDNKEKVKLNRTLPYLVANVVEVRRQAQRQFAPVHHAVQTQLLDDLEA